MNKLLNVKKLITNRIATAMIEGGTLAYMKRFIKGRYEAIKSHDDYPYIVLTMDNGNINKFSLSEHAASQRIIIAVKNVKFEDDAYSHPDTDEGIITDIQNIYNVVFEDMTLGGTVVQMPEFSWGYDEDGDKIIAIISIDAMSVPHMLKDIGANNYVDGGAFDTVFNFFTGINGGGL